MLEEAIEGRLELLIPQVVLVELERVLLRKLAFEQQQVQAVHALLAQIAAEEPAPAAIVEAITGDPADDAVLACAVEAGAEVLVTGDKRHLLPVGEYRGVRIVTPQALLAELRQLG